MSRNKKGRRHVRRSLTPQGRLRVSRALTPQQRQQHQRWYAKNSRERQRKYYREHQQKNRGSLNQDGDNPLRLAAQARDEMHYFTGEPCFRGHVSKRYTKSGRCIECCHEDRRTYEAGHPESSQRRSNSPGHRRLARSIHQRKVALYDQLVKTGLYERMIVAGLPIRPEHSLHERREIVWRAVRALASDKPYKPARIRRDPNSVRARCEALNLDKHVSSIRNLMQSKKISFDHAVDLFLARRARREDDACKRAAAEAEHQSRVRSRKAAIADLRVVAAEHGLTYERLLPHIRRGKTVSEALSLCKERKRLTSFTRLADRNGISRNTFYTRIYVRKWSRQRAATEPPTNSRPDPDSISSRARRNGVSVTAAMSRIKQLGWSVDRAVSAPMRDINSISKRARQRGLKPSIVYCRTYAGWSLERALSTPAREPKHPAPKKG